LLPAIIANEGTPHAWRNILAAQTIMYLTDTASADRQREKNLHYLLPSQTNEIVRPYACIVSIERAYAP
jgi:hypothetical protein